MVYNQGVPYMATKGGKPIDVDNPGQDDLEKMKKATKVIAEYLGEAANVRDSIKQSLEDLIQDLEADKDSAKAVKKAVRGAAAAVAKGSGKQVVSQNSALENLLRAVGEVA